LALNWFEGGRRINKLLMALIAVGGIAAIFSAYNPVPMITSRGPATPWFVDTEPCKYPSYGRTVPELDWGGTKPGLTLCFLTLENGGIPYAAAPAPPEEKARQEAEDRARGERNEPPIPRLTNAWFYADDRYSPRVSAYIEKTVTDLRIEPELKQQINSTSWRWRAFKRAWGEVIPWVFGLCLAIWLITAVVGWIVRGFAGVPTGKDFRPKAEADA